MSPAGEEPHTGPDLLGGHVGLGGYDRRRRDGRRRLRRGDVGVDRLASRMDLCGGEIVDLAMDLCGQLQAADVLIFRKRRGDDHIAEVGMVGAARDRQRQARRINRHGPLTVAQAEIGLARRSSRAHVGDRHSRRGGGPQRRHRMMQEVDPPIALCRSPDARRFAFGVEVEGHIAIERLALHLRLHALEVGELRRARLRDDLPLVLEIDLARVVRQLEGLGRRLGLQVLSEVVVHAGPLDGDRARGLDAGPAADRTKRIVQELLFG